MTTTYLKRSLADLKNYGGLIGALVLMCCLFSYLSENFFTLGTLGTLAKLGAVSTAGWLDHAREADIAGDYIAKLGVRSRDAGQAVAELSGGNQQKVVIARWLNRDCPVMLFDEPTRGIDIGAKFDIYNVLADLARQGKGLIIVSSDLRELMLICDRIAVMSAGRIADTFERGAWSQDQLLSAAFSGYLSSSDTPSEHTTAAS